MHYAKRKFVHYVKRTFVNYAKRKFVHYAKRKFVHYARRKFVHYTCCNRHNLGQHAKSPPPWTMRRIAKWQKGCE